VTSVSFLLDGKPKGTQPSKAQGGIINRALRSEKYIPCDGWNECPRDREVGSSVTAVDVTPVNDAAQPVAVVHERMLCV
jgi:hypothetical protein